MIRLLIVEDDPSWIGVLIEAISKLGTDLDIQLAKSRTGACELLDAKDFDLIICDLKIPVQDGGLDSDVAHGESVYAYAKKKAQGVPFLFLSAFQDVDILQRLLPMARPMDIFGNRAEYPMLQSFKKGNLDTAISRISSFVDELRTLDRDIEVADGGSGLSLSLNERRVLKIYGRRNEGKIVRVSALGGGLSASRTLRLEVLDSAFTPKALIVGKINDIDAIEDEKRRYEIHISPRLPAGSYTAFAGHVCAGACKLGGIFYRLADGFDLSLFQLLMIDEAAATISINKIREYYSPWLAAAPSRFVTIKEIRRGLLPDDKMASVVPFLNGIDWQEFENNQISIRLCARHRDLHGLNILVTRDGKPLLIDFGDVDSSSASLDPITLELSLLFHPKGRDVVGAWPTIPQAREWVNLESYLEGCPVKAFIKSCREWAYSDAAGSRELCANVYAYVARQLKYEQTNKDLAIGIIHSVMQAFRST